MTSLSDKAGFLIAANLVKYAVGFILPMVLVRMVSQSDYGTYQQLVLIGNSLTVLALGLPTSVYYFYHQAAGERRSALVAQTSVILALSGVFGAVILLIGAEPIARTFNNPEIAGLLRFYAWSIAFIVASEHAIALLIVQDRYRLAVLFEVAENIVRVALLLVPLWLGYELPGLVAGIVAFAVLRYGVRLVSILNSPGMRFGGWTASSFVGEQLAYCAPLALTTFAWMIATTFNKGIVAAHFSPAQYAIYAVGALEIPLDVIFQISVHNILRASLPPLVREGRLDEMVRIMREAVRKLAIIVLPSFVFLFSHADEFITALFTASYVESVDIFRIYVLVVPLHMLVLSPVPQVFGKTKLHLYVNVGVLAALVGLSYYLLKAVGFYGPAIAWTASQYLGAVLFFIVVVRLTRSTPLALLPVRAFARIVAGALIAAVAAKLATGLAASPLANLLIAAAVFSVVFLGVAPLLGVFTEDDRRLIRRWMAKVLPIAP